MPFTLFGVWQLCGRGWFPAQASVVGEEHREAPIHRVAQCNSMNCIPEGKRIQKDPGVVVLKPKDPRDAPIVGLVNTGFGPFADRQQERLAIIEGVYVAEVETLGPRDLSWAAPRFWVQLRMGVRYKEFSRIANTA